MKTIQMLVGICALSLTATAGTVFYSVNVTFDDGGTATGSFGFNADSGTACTTGNTPCGTYSNVNIVTTTTGNLSGATYNTICGVGTGSSCAGVTPDSTEVEFLASGGANLTGVQGIAFFFLPPGPVPPNGLSDAGGKFLVDNSANAGVVLESFCNDATCDAPTGASRTSVAGTVATPEPSTALLLAAPLAMFGLKRLLKRA